MKKESVLLAQTYKPGKHFVTGSYMSEKLDGMRCLWLPFTRGMRKKDVPFANNAKDERLLKEEICTGLWSRYMNVVHCPDWWLDDMPNIIMDGELYSTTLPRQEIMSIVKKKNDNVVSEAWEDVQFFAFALPHYTALFGNGVIKSTNFTKVYENVDTWVEQFIPDLDYHSAKPLTMRQEVILLPKYAVGPNVVVVEQEKLPVGQDKAMARVLQELDRVTDKGGEGVMVRSQNHVYQANRSHSLIKFKKLEDDEGTVVGYTTGKITDKESRHRGRLGALILQLKNGRTFELSGFTDAEREFGSQEMHDWAFDNPDSQLPDSMEHTQFPRGMEVTFRYRGVSNDGIPNEARYWRKRCATHG